MNFSCSIKILLSKSGGFLFLSWVLRLSHLVNAYCCRWTQKTWLERVEKRIKCIQQNAQQANRSLWNISHFFSTAKSYSNVVSVKYSEKKKSWNFWTSSWIRTENSLPTFTFCGDQYSRSLFLACSLLRLKVLAWDDWQFDNKLPTL